MLLRLSAKMQHKCSQVLLSGLGGATLHPVCNNIPSFFNGDYIYGASCTSFLQPFFRRFCLIAGYKPWKNTAWLSLLVAANL